MFGDVEIDFTPPFARKTYAELFQQATVLIRRIRQKC